MSYNPNAFNNVFSGTSRATATGFQNASGSTMPQATLVCINGSGQIIPLDPSNESDVQAIVGLTQTSIPNGAVGQVMDNGRLENITTSFPIGSAVYASLTPGELIDTKPTEGVGGFAPGDFVIFIGVIVENEYNPSLFDIKLMISVVGQL
jgi:hypothetical protein